MVETSKLEAYITTTFTKITDEYNRPLNIAIAAPTLFDIISGNTEQYVNHKYEYLGETATMFAISLILAKQYPKFNKHALHALAKKFTGFARLHKVINQEIHLKDHVLSPYLSSTINNIIGVLFSYYGINVVEKFITAAVVHTARLELNVVDTKATEQITNPIYLLNQRIKSENGAVEFTATPLNGQQWCVKLLCRLTEQSCFFSHSRTASNKQRAKTEAAQDILNYLNANPMTVEQLRAPAPPNSGEAHILPIDINDYYQSPYSCQSSMSSVSTPTDTKWPNSPEMNSIHISAEDNDETLQRLSDLLLGGSAQTPKEDQSKKRPRQNLFSASDDQEMPYIKQEEEYKTVQQSTEQNNFNERVVSFFKQMFDKNRSLLSMTKLNPGQSKSVLLSLVVPLQEILHVDIQTAQTGSSHSPLFHAQVVLKSKTKPNVFLKTEGVAQRKKDAEQQAFQRLIHIITQQ